MNVITDALILKETATRGQVAAVYGLGAFFIGMLLAGR